MGQAYEFKCTCGYTFTPALGIGYLFPVEYEELKDAAENGEYGEELKDFFAAHPDGVINAEHVVARCRKCGKYECVPKLDMYLPKQKAVSKAPLPWDLKESWNLYEEYTHTCTSCGGDMEIISEDELDDNGIICPNCGRPVRQDAGATIFWD